MSAPTAGHWSFSAWRRSKREIEINREFPRLFGNPKGNLWQEGMVALPNGVAIQALGRDMSVTGMKYLDTRPDAPLVDDVKDPEEVRSDVERKGSRDWLRKTLLLSLDHPLRVWIRALGTRRGTGSLPSSTGYPMSRRQGRRKTSQANSIAF